MAKENRLIVFMTAISLVVALSLFATTASGEGFIPPVPDKTKTLPANDGGLDGCDSSRFKCVMGGEAVLDNQTGLVWVRDAQFFGKEASWEDAVKFCESMKLDGKNGWRLPSKDELITILDTSQSEPALPEGHPFLNIDDLATSSGGGRYTYWTSTDLEDDDDRAWIVSFHLGNLMDSLKLMESNVWPVRDGE